MVKKILKALVATSLIVTSFMTNVKATNEVKQDAEMMDDYDARFVYSSGDANHGGWDGSNSTDPIQSEHWSNIPGANVTITFTGNKFELYGKKAPNHRKFSVKIDNGEAKEFDAYAATATDNNSLLYSSEVAGLHLEEKEHKAIVTILDKANSNATDTLGMNIAYAKVYHGENAENYSIIEDSNETKKQELFKIQYKGTWGGAGETYPDFHGGTEHWSTQNGSYELKFIGKKVEIYGTKDPKHGEYPVTIDGKQVGKAIGKGASRVHQQLLFCSQNLENTEHTLKVEAQKGKDIQVDYIKVYHDEINPQKITFNKTNLTMGTNDVMDLIVNVEPWVATTKNIKWSSSDEKVATVVNGKVTSKNIDKKATTTIKAYLENSKDVFAEATVNVDPKQSFMNVYVGDEKRLDLSEQYNVLKDGSGSKFDAIAWKNDQLNSKIIVTTRTKQAKNLTLTASDFINENKQTIRKDNIEIKWLKEVQSKVGRNEQGPTKEFPAIIHKGGEKNLEANKVAFAWVNINIPKDTEPGTYHGTITATADNQEPIELYYTIEVLDIEQPTPMNTDIQIWQHPFAVANYYLGLGEQPNQGISWDKKEDFYFTPEHFNLMRQSMKEYASIGGHDVVANIVEEAWNHQSYYNDLSMVKWTKKADGTWKFDYKWYDQWINFMIECGVIDPAKNIGQIKCYSIVPWNNQIAYYDESSKKVVKKSYTPGSDEFNKVWTAFLSDFMNHSKQNGWFDITYIAMDERELKDLQPAVKTIESVKDEKGNHFKISSCLNYSAPKYYEFTDRIHDISINLDNCNVQQTNELSNHRRTLGLKTTYYSCTGNYPSNFIISDPADNYWTMWYTMTLGTDGYLRWAWDNYVYNMHQNVTYRYWEPGDGWFIYPVERENLDMSKDVSFYSTPKYELFKQGIRDVEKAKYLMKKNDKLNKEVNDLVKSMKKPAKGNYHGSAVALTKKQRELVHSETKRMIDGVNDLAKEYIKTNVVDKSDLIKKLDEGSKLNKDLYTKESWNQLQSCIESAKAVNENKQATQEEVMNAITSLTNAIHQLVYKDADYTKVDAAIKKAESLHKEDYSNYSEVEKAIANVKRGYDITKQKEVDAMAKAIEDAINGLKENPGLTPIGPSTHKIPWMDLETAHKEVPMTELKPATKAEKPNSSNKVEQPQTPNTGVETNTAVLWSVLLGAGAILLVSKKRKILR